MDEQAMQGLFVALTIVFLVVLLGVIPAILSKYKNKIKEQQAKINEQEAMQAKQKEIDLLTQASIVKDKDLVIEKLQTEMKGQAQDLAVKQFDQWKERELETHRKVIIQAAIERAKVTLAEWKIEVEKELRKDAVTRSMGVNFGKITEHLIPFSSHLAEFDPRDVRFIGSPVDLMIFSGATAKKNVIDIYFVEIKTGSGKLSKKQKTIQEAIEGHRIHWKPIIVPEFEWDVNDDEEESEPGTPMPDLMQKHIKEIEKEEEDNLPPLDAPPY